VAGVYVAGSPEFTLTSVILSILVLFSTDRLVRTFGFVIDISAGDPSFSVEIELPDPNTTLIEVPSASSV
jgi:hypothetical protein